MHGHQQHTAKADSVGRSSDQSIKFRARWAQVATGSCPWRDQGLCNTMGIKLVWQTSGWISLSHTGPDERIGCIDAALIPPELAHSQSMAVATLVGLVLCVAAVAVQHTESASVHLVDSPSSQFLKPTSAEQLNAKELSATLRSLLSFQSVGSLTKLSSSKVRCGPGSAPGTYGWPKLPACTGS